MVQHITVADSKFIANGTAFTAAGPDTLIVDRAAFLISDSSGAGAFLTGGPWTVLVNGVIGSNTGNQAGFLINSSSDTSRITIGTHGHVFGGQTALGSFTPTILTNMGIISVSDPFAEAVFLGDFADTFNNFKKVGKVIKSGTVLGPITLGGGDDHFNGGAKSETVREGDGSDTIKFGGGNDFYLAAPNAFLPNTADGADIINGGAGVDTYDLTGVAAVFLINLDTKEHDGLAAQSAVKVFATTDTIISFENVIGGPGADVIYGSRGANVIQGGDNTDVIYGLGGADRLSGGDGADTFHFQSLADSGTKASNRDLITDYSRFSGDKIDLSAIDANAGAAGEGGFTVIGFDHFSHHRGELREIITNGNTIISGDVNGDGKADFSIALRGYQLLTDADFVL
jgi:Ca2+-binding RTX toxin-like protein